MNCYSLRNFTLLILVTLLVWSSTLEPCNARKGKHWRQSRATSASLYKKSKSHGNSHKHQSKGSNGSKQKPPSPPPSQEPTIPKVAPPPPPVKGNDDGNAPMLNVLDFGAKGDGYTDDTKAFQAAWAAACKVEASTIVVPSEYVFLIGPISFSGPYCESNIVFQLDGTIIAPTSARAWGSGLLQWIEFTKLRGITIQGKGIIDGRGSVWWQNSVSNNPIDDETQLVIPIADNADDEGLNTPIGSELSWKMPGTKPTALRFYGSFDVTVTGITIQNSPQCHLKFDNCIGVQAFNINISSPGDSLNTDGIHLQNSRDVLIYSTSLACGKFCLLYGLVCLFIYHLYSSCSWRHV
ncbi:hypothetical protein IFM89_038786 [Coptis chinensis]|uniref:Polygalacturonase n=1 Tax=Coptis chinensis TaxID=261450 RepID=A0A835J0D4_9MAGN|nr:hypothetical protein IFM89_038786 [Coptis chinensis]